MKTVLSVESIATEMPHTISLCSGGTTYVDMNQAAVAVLEPGAKTPTSIFTDGLVGCTAAAIIGDLPTGAKVAYLQHFHPEKHDQSQTNIESVLSVLEKAGGMVRAGVVYTPGTKKGIFMPKHVPQYPWAMGLLEAMQAVLRYPSAPMNLRTYRSPGPAHSLRTIIGTSWRASGVVSDSRKTVARC